MRLANFMLSMLLCLALAPLAVAGENNPADDGTAGLQPVIESRSLVGYSDYATWRDEFEHSVVIDFEEFTSGTTITDQLSSYLVDAVSGVSSNGACAQYAYSSENLPFSMFTAGTLPSETNFLANDWNSPFYCTGEIVFELSAHVGAIGAYVADGAPLDDFAIEVFDGDTSLGSISVPPRTLPDAFVGVVSDVWFDKVRFYAVSENDSWGLDNVEILDPILPATDATMSQIKALYR